MNFWNTYVSECLQSPWMIRPENQYATPSMDFDKTIVFLVEEFLPDEAYTMLSKMIAAIQLKNEDVMILNQGEASVQMLENQSQSKKVICFGEAFPGTLGESVHWMGHEIVKTHSLKTLLEKPAFKKETWVHLKKYRQLI
jgi:DNA polymerase III psi subunit